ncbi:methylated-DNA--[protein]-cysteine S-methyltransferase [Candidatus Bathyarchaeota archaeon]|nr:methylated-DNA--[protein]-cysteine S-methyltransferase [Candidatus Bathyarchaeota archaeon]
MNIRGDKIKAVLERNTVFDGQFVYGVKSTLIYCRPSCPSRRPKTENIMLFDSPKDAEEAGYRACLRCDPSEYHPPNEAFVERITNYIALNLDGKLTLGRLATEFNVSKYHLQRTFKSVLGMSPRQYIEARRLELFKSHIRNGENVESAMTGSGFKSRSRLYEKVPEKLGMTPTEYREGGSNVSIWYTVIKTTITKMLVARTGRGICALYMGQSEARLVDALMEEYPYALIIRDDGALRDAIGPLTSYFEGENYNPRLPLDIHRTAFQWRVLKAIQEIPPGETKTYSELAKSIGNPNSFRAVANAIARNPVGILVPCHRVLRKDGGLGGYRWGLPLKERLLEHETRS